MADSPDVTAPTNEIPLESAATRSSVPVSSGVPNTSPLPGAPGLGLRRGDLSPDQNISTAPTIGDEGGGLPSGILRPATPATYKESMLHKIGGALSGATHTTTYKVDPMTGKVDLELKPKTGRQEIMGAVANILQGMAAGAGKKGFGQGFSAGASAVQNQLQQRQQQQRQQATEDFDTQQKAKLQQATILRYNADAAKSMAEAIAKGTQDILNSSLTPIYNAAVQNGGVVEENVTDEAAMKGAISGKYDPKQVMFVPRKSVPVFDSENKPTDKHKVIGAIVKNAPFSFSDHPDFPKADAVKFGWVSPNATNTQSALAANIALKVHSANDGIKDLKSIYDKVGLPAPNIDEVIKKYSTSGMPSKFVGDGLDAFESYYRRNGSVEKAIDAMNTSKQDKTGKEIKNPNSQYVSLISELLPSDVVRKYDNAIEGEKAGSKKAAEEEATAATPKGKMEAKLQAQRLANEQQSSQKTELEIKKLTQDLSGAALAGKIATVATDASPTSDNPHLKSDGLKPLPGYKVNNQILDTIRQDNPGLANLIEAVGTGRQLMTPQAQRTKDGQNFMQMVMAAYPDLNEARVQAYYKAREDKNLHQTLNILSTSMEHLGTYYDNLGPISGTAGVGRIAKELGSQTAANVTSAKQAAADEFGKLYSGGKATDTEKKLWDEALGGTTWLGKEGGAKSAAELLSGKYNALVTQLRNATPPGLYDDSLRLFSPQAAAAYKRITGKDLENISQPMTQGSYPVQNRPQTQPAQTAPQPPKAADPGMKWQNKTVNGEIQWRQVPLTQ